MGHTGAVQIPSVQTGPHVWSANELLADPASWTHHLDEETISELEAAAVGDIHEELPNLDRLAATVTAGLLDGRGMIVVRGLAIDTYSEQTAERMLEVFGRRLGSLRPQNASGHLIGHVRDVGADVTDPNTRIYQTSERQTFHTDSCDVVGLLCLRTAMQGGESMLASSSTVYNQMLSRRPDLLARLFEPIATDRRGEIPSGMKPWFEIPVFSWHRQQLTAMYQRQYIDSAKRFPEAPTPDEEYTAALDLFDSIANEPAVHVTMDFEPGDMQFVHNHSLLHDRMSFVDWPEPERRRHLLRVWVAIDGDRELPDVFAQRYGSVTVGDRGGIIVRG